MKIVARILIVLITLVLMGWLALWLFAGPYIKSSIEDRLTYYQSDTVSLGAVHFEIFPVGLSIKDAYFNFNMPMDSALVNWKGEIAHAQVKGVDWLKALKGEGWDVMDIEVGNGDLAWTVRSTPYQDTLRFLPETKDIKPNLYLKRVQMENLRLSLDRDSFNINLQTSLGIEDLYLNRRDESQWKLKRVWLHSENAVFNNVLTDFELAYESLHYDTRDSIIQLQGIDLKPLLSEEQFRGKYSHRKIQPKLYIAQARLTGVQHNALNRGLFAKKLILDSCDFAIYQDLRRKREVKNRPLPSEMISKIPMVVNIDSVVLKRGYLSYTHQGEFVQYGEANITLDEITLKAYPISNLKHPIAAGVVISAEAILQKKAKLDLILNCIADEPEHDFNLKIHMSSTPMTAFNSLLYPTVGLKVRQGYCSEARVDMKGNDKACWGDLDIAYTDFKIDLPPEPKRDFKLIGRLKQGVGNLALVNTNNTINANNGEIYYLRHTNEPFLNFWWKGIEGGLLDAMVRFYKNPDKSQ